MSIYSGFATRNLEGNYNRGVCQMLNLCQLSLISLLKSGKGYIETISVQALARSFNKIFKNLRSLEQQKHLEPKFTEYCSELAGYLGFDEATMLSHGQPSHTTINSDLDFHILNDVLAYDSSRVAPAKLVKRKITPVIHSQIAKQNLDDSMKVSRKSLQSQERPPRTSSTRVTPNIYEKDRRRRYQPIAKQRKGRKIDPAQLYHDQAMSLIYNAMDS